MITHMKYELRKSLFSKIILLLVTAIAEIVFLVGLFSKKDTPLAWGISGLSICACVGIFYIGIESLVTFHKDLNTKQSYMLFLTPYSSYTILGAKILQNALAILAAGAVFVLIGCLDAVIAMAYMDGMKALVEMLQEMMHQIGITVNIHLYDIILAVVLTLVSWLFAIVVGYFAIIMSATVLAGKKVSGLVSLVIYFAVNYFAVWCLNRVPSLPGPNTDAWVTIGITVVFIVIIYIISGWIMEKKLSV